MRREVMGMIVGGEESGRSPNTILLSAEGAVDTDVESYLTSMRIDSLGEGRRKWVAGRGPPQRVHALNKMMLALTLRFS